MGTAISIYDKPVVDGGCTRKALFKTTFSRGLFDLRTNLNFCLQTHQDERVQEIQIEREILDEAIPQMEAHLLVLADKLQQNIG